jgi:hypothetical protein
MENKIKAYASYTHYTEAREKARPEYKPSITGDKSGNLGLRQLERMKGKDHIHKTFTKRITGFEVIGESVTIHFEAKGAEYLLSTTRKPVTLPLKNLQSQLNRLFFPAYSTSKYDR